MIERIVLRGGYRSQVEILDGTNSLRRSGVKVFDKAFIYNNLSPRNPNRTDRRDAPDSYLLPVDSQSKFHIARRASPAFLTERRRAREAQARTAGLEMIQDISYQPVELRAYPLFINADIFDDIRVQAPRGKTTETAATAAACVISQHARPEFVPDRRWIAECVETVVTRCLSADSRYAFHQIVTLCARGVNVVFGGGTASVWQEPDRAFRRTAGPAGPRSSNFTKPFAARAVTLGISHLRGAAASRRKQRRDSPAAQKVPEYPMLTPEEGLVINHRQVVECLIVETLRAIVALYIKRVHRS